MKPMMLAGAALTALGVIVLIFRGGLNYTSRETYPPDGQTQVIAKQEKIVTIPPWVGGLALAGGVTLMLVAARK